MAKKKIKSYFAFKDGYCHFSEQKILLTKNEIFSEQELIEKKSTPWTQVLVYAFFSILFSLYFFDQYQYGYKWLSIIFLIFASFFSIGAVNILTLSLHPIMQRSNIKKVEYVKAIPIVAPASIVFHFTENGKKQKVWLYLEKEQIEEALNVVKNQGFRL